MSKSVATRKKGTELGTNETGRVEEKGTVLSGPELDSMLPLNNKGLFPPAAGSAAQRCPSAVGPLWGWAALIR